MTPKFNKAERHEIYKRLLDEVDKPIGKEAKCWDDEPFICIKLSVPFFDADNSEGCNRIAKACVEFPEWDEIYMQVDPLHWFTRNERVIALTKCIEMSKPDA